MGSKYSLRNSLYFTGLAGLISSSGCRIEASCDEESIKKVGERINWDGETIDYCLPWPSESSFEEVLDRFTVLVTLNPLDFCAGVDGEEEYDTCVMFYGPFKEGLDSTITSFEQETTRLDYISASGQSSSTEGFYFDQGPILFGGGIQSIQGCDDPYNYVSSYLYYIQNDTSKRLSITVKDCPEDYAYRGIDLLIGSDMREFFPTAVTSNHIALHSTFSEDVFAFVDFYCSESDPCY